MSSWKTCLPHLEWSLIEGKWRPSLDAIENPPAPIFGFVRNVIDGNLQSALNSDLAKQLLTLNHSTSLISSDGTFNGRLDSYFPLNLEADDETAELVRLTLAVASLHAFLQINWTGPDVNTLDILILPTLPSTPLTNEILSTQAISELATGGEPAYHLAKSPEFIRIAQIIFSRGFETLRTSPWCLRTHLIHQQLLDDPVPVPEHLWISLALLEKLEDQDLVGRLKLEQGLLRDLLL